MRLILFFFLFSFLQADLYDRNKYNLDFPRQDQPQHAVPVGPDVIEYEDGEKRILPHHPHNLRNCPCDPGDPQCPCEIDENGNWRRVD